MNPLTPARQALANIIEKDPIDPGFGADMERSRQRRRMAVVAVLLDEAAAQRARLSTSEPAVSDAAYWALDGIEQWLRQNGRGDLAQPIRQQLQIPNPPPLDAPNSAIREAWSDLGRRLLQDATAAVEA